MRVLYPRGIEKPPDMMYKKRALYIHPMIVVCRSDDRHGVSMVGYSLAFVVRVSMRWRDRSCQLVLFCFECVDRRDVGLYTLELPCQRKTCPRVIAV